MSAKRLVISGRVQRVGFRHWIAAEASRLGVSGWVRNRADGAVEALVHGDSAAVEELLRACRLGPPLAEIASITEELAEPEAEPGFRRIG